MKVTFSILAFLLFMKMCFAQPNTEVFLFDFKMEDNKNCLSNLKNISNNEGYDNQPYFLNNNTVLFASTRNGQTDIAKYSIKYNSKYWLNHSEQGSEYSPLKIPNKQQISAIRLDKDGTQNLRAYNLSNGESTILVDKVVIGYHVWHDKNTLVSSTLKNNALTLTLSNLKTDTHTDIIDNVGRSLHNIPNSNLISFIDKNNQWTVSAFNPKNQEIKPIFKTLPESEDMCWLPDGTMLMAQGSRLYAYKPNHSADWTQIQDLKTFGIKNITRVASNPKGTKLAVVGELKDNTTQTQLNLAPKLENIAWIAGNWKGEAFGGTVEENWSEPSSGSMMATFKLHKDNKISFYEIEIIREIENTLILQLKHFDNTLKGWEAKDETIDFPLKQITPTKVVFEGMTFEKISDTEMNVYVDLKDKNGQVKTLKINYTK